MKKSNHLMPSILTDNQANYVSLIETSIAHAVSYIEDIKYSLNGDEFTVRIILGDREDYSGVKENLIKNLIGVHRRLKIPIEFSKSTKIQKSITFKNKQNE